MKDYQALVRRACFDPGQFVKREFTPSEYGGTDAEPLHEWQARAVLAATDHEGAVEAERARIVERIRREASETFDAGLDLEFRALADLIEREGGQ